MCETGSLIKFNIARRESSIYFSADIDSCSDQENIYSIEIDTIIVLVNHNSDYNQ